MRYTGSQQADWHQFQCAAARQRSERRKSLGTVHMAVERHTLDGYGGQNRAPIHLDGVIGSPTLVVDGPTLIKDGS